MSERTNDLLAELTGSDLQTDHGNLTFGDLVVLLLDLVLLVYTGWRSYDFLTTTVPSGWEALALVGLWGLDIGAVAWSLVWIFGSTGKFQNWTSMAFFVIDLVGVMLTSLTDSLMYSQGEAVMKATLSGITTIAIPLVMFGNIVAGFVYHMTSPETRARRKARQAEYEHREKMLRVVEMDHELTYAEAYLLARQDMLDKAQLLAEIKTQQDILERKARLTLHDRSKVHGLNSENSVTDQGHIEALRNQFPAENGSGNNGQVDNEGMTHRLSNVVRGLWKQTDDQGNPDAGLVPTKERTNGNGEHSKGPH
jgi:hypothetical protein